MSDQMNQAPPPAAQLMQVFFGIVPTLAIGAAAKFGIADFLKDGPKTADELASLAGVHSRSLYRLLRATASVGVFSEDADGRFRMTPMAEPLRSDAPDSVRSFAIFFSDDWHMRVWAELPYSVQHGTPAFDHINGKEFFPYLEENSTHAKVFNDAMTSNSAAACAAVLDGYDFSGINKLVDVGGGHGLLLSSIMAKYAQMSGVLYDAQSVINGATAIISERCEAVGGDFFQSVPAGGDAYIMKHIIHDWDDEHSLKILRNCREAMTENGKVLVVEMIIPPGDAPSPGKFLDLEMLLFLRSFERTEAEYRALFDRAGLELTRIVPTPSPYSVLEGVRK